jgi:hypothetical protein
MHLQSRRRRARPTLYYDGKTVRRRRGRLCGSQYGVDMGPAPCGVCMDWSRVRREARSICCLKCQGQGGYRGVRREFGREAVVERGGVFCVRNDIDTCEK